MLFCALLLALSLSGGVAFAQSQGSSRLAEVVFEDRKETDPLSGQRRCHRGVDIPPTGRNAW